MGWYIARMGDEKCLNLFVRKPEVERPLVRHRLRREDNIRMDLRET